LYITTLQPLELAFFNSITKFLTILYFESFSIFFYLLYSSYMLYNSKWFENFQACSQLALKNESKEAPPFWINNVTLWSVAAQLFARQKKRNFVTLNANILQSTQWKFLKSFSHLFIPTYYKILWLQVSKNVFFSSQFGTCTKNDSFGAF